MSNLLQRSDSLMLGSLLAFAGGLLDAYSFMARGGVLATAQTGNMVFFAVSIVKGEISTAYLFITPIIVFSAGVLTALIVRHNTLSVRKWLHWRQLCLAAEIAVLLAVAFVKSDLAANCAISFVCGVQVSSFRAFNGNAYATTMCTGNLKSAIDFIFSWLFEKKPQALKHALSYFIIVGMFILGAVAGGAIVILTGKAAVIAACIILSACLALMFQKNCAQEEEKNFEVN